MTSLLMDESGPREMSQLPVYDPFNMASRRGAVLSREEGDMMRRQWLAYVWVCGALVALLASAGCQEKKPAATAVNLKSTKIIESPNSGWLGGVTVQDGKVIAAGWAENGDTLEAPDLVVIANQNLDVLATAAPSLDRPDVVQATKLPKLAKSGFRIVIDPAVVISTGTAAISAYAYSTRDGKAYRQRGIWAVTIEGGKITQVAVKN